jgi:hypothetical protein
MAVHGMWQTIKTAPRDGTDILVYAECFCLVVSWDDEAAPSHPWITADGPSYSFGLFTHWMPLPTPPDAGGDGDR